MNSVDISVIVPVYNCANYLTDLLDSLRSQTGVSLEIIAVNDGSTDHSLALLEQVAHIDSRLVIINQQNQGLSEARNVGIAKAKGNWIAFADGDDWLAPHALSTWLQQVKQQKLDVLIGNGYQFSSNPERKPVTPYWVNSLGERRSMVNNGLSSVLNKRVATLCLVATDSPRCDQHSPITVYSRYAS